jgi:hypothetical protein
MPNESEHKHIFMSEFKRLLRLALQHFGNTPDASMSWNPVETGAPLVNGKAV